MYLQGADIYYLEDLIDYITALPTFPKNQQLVVFIIS